MAPFIVLIVVTGITRLIGLAVAPLDSWNTCLAIGLAAMFLVGASAHFLPTRRAGLIAMVPPTFPRPDLIVTVTGILEIAGAVGLLLPQTRTLAAVCLAVLLLAMFPANVRAARAKSRGQGVPGTPLVPRTIMQVLFIGACAVVVLA